ncbi:hypothetical protein [Campylobacter sp.]|uniref:hypothetical protein n=1 Tax=Campylobacter sp. TaxID=205 RepID=UPI0027B9EDB1|nr:hypothetical protein [Campylobacter sp.]
MKLYKSIKFKVLAGVLLLAAILCAAFIRIIPDFSTSRGFAIVSLPDYNKYKQGYCLKEDRILPREERFRRGILDTLERYVLFHAAIANRCYYMYGMEQCNYGSTKFAVKVGFYETDKFNNDDWLEVLSKEYEMEKRKNQDAWLYRNIFVEKFQMKPVDIAEKLKLNLKEGFAGFDMPVIEYAGLNKYLLYLDKSFILYDDFKFSAILVRVPEGYTPKDLLDRRQYYEREIQARSYSEDDFKIDTCGNSDFKIYKNNVEEIADRLVREDLFKGG